MVDTPFSSPQPPGADQPSAPSAPAQQQAQGQAPKIDVERLADKVYRLMLADIRLSVARGVGAAHRSSRER